MKLQYNVIIKFLPRINKGLRSLQRGAVFLLEKGVLILAREGGVPYPLHHRHVHLW